MSGTRVLYVVPSNCAKGNQSRMNSDFRIRLRCSVTSCRVKHHNASRAGYPLTHDEPHEGPEKHFANSMTLMIADAPSSSAIVHKASCLAPSCRARRLRLFRGEGSTVSRTEGNFNKRGPRLTPVKLQHGVQSTCAGAVVEISSSEECSGKHVHMLLHHHCHSQYCFMRLSGFLLVLYYMK